MLRAGVAGTLFTRYDGVLRPVREHDSGRWTAVVRRVARCRWRSRRGRDRSSGPRSRRDGGCWSRAAGRRCRPGVRERGDRGRTGSAWPCHSRSWRCRCVVLPCELQADAARDCARGAGLERRWLPAGRLPGLMVGEPAPVVRELVRALRPRGICGSGGTAHWLSETAPNCSGRNVVPHVVRQVPSWLP